MRLPAYHIFEGLWLLKAEVYFNQLVTLDPRFYILNHFLNNESTLFVKLLQRPVLTSRTMERRIKVLVTRRPNYIFEPFKPLGLVNFREKIPQYATVYINRNQCTPACHPNSSVSSFHAVWISAAASCQFWPGNSYCQGTQGAASQRSET